MSHRRRMLLERITVNPEILNGKPVIREKWLTVEVILGMLADGATFEGLRKIYPSLDEEDVLACLAYAYYLIARD